MVGMVRDGDVDDHGHTVANPAKGKKPGERGAGPVKPTGYRPGGSRSGGRKGRSANLPAANDRLFVPRAEPTLCSPIRYPSRGTIRIVPELFGTLFFPSQ